MELEYRTTLTPVWFGHFGLSSIRTAYLYQFLENFEEMFFAQINHLVRPGPSCKSAVELTCLTILIPVSFDQSSLASIRPACLNQFLENFDEMFFTQSNRVVCPGRDRGSSLLYHVDTSLVCQILAGYYFANVS